MIYGLLTNYHHMMGNDLCGEGWCVRSDFTAEVTRQPEANVPEHHLAGIGQAHLCVQTQSQIITMSCLRVVFTSGLYQTDNIRGTIGRILNFGKFVSGLFWMAASNQYFIIFY